MTSTAESASSNWSTRALSGAQRRSGSGLYELRARRVRGLLPVPRRRAIEWTWPSNATRRAPPGTRPSATLIRVTSFDSVRRMIGGCAPSAAPIGKSSRSTTSELAVQDLAGLHRHRHRGMLDRLAALARHDRRTTRTRATTMSHSSMMWCAAISRRRFSRRSTSTSFRSAHLYGGYPLLPISTMTRRARWSAASAVTRRVPDPASTSATPIRRREPEHQVHGLQEPRQLELAHHAGCCWCTTPGRRVSVRAVSIATSPATSRTPRRSNSTARRYRSRPIP